MVGQTVSGTGRRSRPRCRALDGLIADGREVWLLVGREPGELASLLVGGEGLTLCRAVLPDGTLLLGRASADRDPLLSDLLGESGRARR
jgi:hypothetical protein